MSRHQLGLCAVALLGAYGLAQLAHRSLHEPLKRNVFVSQSDLLRIRTTEKFHEFARTHRDIESHEKLMEFVRRAGLEHHWMALTFRSHLSDGTVTQSEVVCHPDSPAEAFRFELMKSSLEKLAVPGQVEVRIFSDSRLKENPLSVLGDLEEAGR